MNYLAHPAAALVIQALVRRGGGTWWAGAGIASAYFLGRELAQAEYRWIEWFGHHHRAEMPWWGPLDPRVWPKLDQWVDWLGPVAATGATALAMGRRRTR